MPKNPPDGLAQTSNPRGNYGNELVAALSGWVLAQANVEELVAREVLVGNVASRPALENAGFALERETTDSLGTRCARARKRTVVWAIQECPPRWLALGLNWRARDLGADRLPSGPDRIPIGRPGRETPQLRAIWLHSEDPLPNVRENKLSSIW